MSNVVPIRPDLDDADLVGSRPPVVPLPAGSPVEDILTVEVPVYVLMQAEVLPALVGGMQVVAFQMTVKNTATGADEYLVIAVASEDAKKLSQRINSVAATVKPINKQIPQEDTRP